MKTTDFIRVKAQYGIVREQRMQGDFKIEQPDGSTFYAFPEQCEVITENEYLRGAQKGGKPDYEFAESIRLYLNKHKYVHFKTIEGYYLIDDFNKGNVICKLPRGINVFHDDNGALQIKIDLEERVVLGRNLTVVEHPDLPKVNHIQSFTEAVKPLMQWLRENEHPHVKAIVTGERADLLEEKLGILNNR